MSVTIELMGAIDLKKKYTMEVNKLFGYRHSSKSFVFSRRKKWTIPLISVVLTNHLNEWFNKTYWKIDKWWNLPVLVQSD